MALKVSNVDLSTQAVHNDVQGSPRKQNRVGLLIDQLQGTTHTNRAHDSTMVTGYSK